MPSLEGLRAHTRSSISVGSHPSLSPQVTGHDERGRKSSVQTTISIPDEGKPVASGNGVSVGINLAEPVLFLQGFDQHDPSSRSTAMLRGSLHLKVTKNAKIKAVSLKFKGTATTRWPEGIPPKRIDFEEVDTLMSHTWPFFNAHFPVAEGGSGADVVRLAHGGSEKTQSEVYSNSSPAASSANLHANTREARKLSLQVNQSRSFDKNDPKYTPSVAAKGYRTFYPGDYVYNFELPLDSRLPESIDVDLGSVKYELEATVERAGAFRANLLGTKDVTLIRAPAEGSLEQVEPIAISRNWEDQMHYDIVISGKSFPLGAKVPIAFKLTPLAKVQCHRIKVFVTENTEYFCSNKRVHRMEPTRKVLLFEKRADGPSTSTFPGSSMRVTAGGGVPWDQRDAAASGSPYATNDSSNLLGRLDGETNVGPTEMEFSVQLPGCQNSVTDPRERASRLHFDTTYQNIQVHHWIKIVMRLSKPDTVDPSRRRHFEISIDSPFHILSCRASQANISLPAYTSPGDNDVSQGNLAECGCPGAPRRRVSPHHVPTLQALNGARPSVSGIPGQMPVQPQGTGTGMVAQGGVPVPMEGNSIDSRTVPSRPEQAHLAGPTSSVQRPIHMLRAPSYNPPAFEDDQPPPPLVTPPPQYNDIASPSHGLADYFSRLADAYDEAEDSDEDARSGRGRVRIPLTPGSRINRSLDLPRLPVGV